MLPDTPQCSGRSPTQNNLTPDIGSTEAEEPTSQETDYMISKPAEENEANLNKPPKQIKCLTQETLAKEKTSAKTRPHKLKRDLGCAHVRLQRLHFVKSSGLLLAVPTPLVTAWPPPTSLAATALPSLPLCRLLTPFSRPLYLRKPHFHFCGPQRLGQLG